MRINTTNFGELDVSEDRIITFEDGIPGFEDQKEFVLVNNYDTEEPVPFMWLQATKNPELALVVTIPFFLRPNYEVELPEDAIAALDITSPEDVAVYSVVKIQDKVENLTFNLMSPIIINGKNRKGMQVIQDNGKYKVDEKYVKM